MVKKLSNNNLLCSQNKLLFSDAKNNFAIKNQKLLYAGNKKKLQSIFLKQYLTTKRM